MTKAERLNRELIFLSNKTKFNLADLINEFNISKRTALRDIEALEEFGLSIYVENGRYGGYKIIKQASFIPVYFNSNKITSIFFALKALSLLSTTPFEKSYNEIYKKLLATLSTEQQQYTLKLLDAVNYHNFPTINTTNFLNLMLTSILENKILNIVYTQHKYENKKILVYDLFYRNGVWFSNSLDVENNQWGIYRCDFIEKCTINNEIITNYSREDLKKSLEKHENTFKNIDFKCQITEFGKELFQKDNYPTMELVENSKGIFIKGKFNINELHYLVHYLISFGTNLTILYPKFLIEDYLKSLDLMKNKYK